MSIFNDNINADNPITASFLRDLISKRMVPPEGEPLETTCDKLLGVIYDEVKYSVPRVVYYHRICPKALGLTSAFKKGTNVKKLMYDNKGIHGKDLEPKFVEFCKYFQERGFKMKIKWDVYDDDPTMLGKYIEINWEEEN
jgi:hypothetical protein